MGVKNARIKGNRAARKDRQAAAEPAVTHWIPEPEDCDPPQVETLPLSATLTLVQRVVYLRGQLADYAIMLRIRDRAGDDHEIARIDCCHGQVHRHTINLPGRDSDARAVLREIRSQQDVIDSFPESFTEMFERRDEHERRWRDDPGSSVLYP